MSKAVLRILLGRFHLDGHDRGILTIMEALRNAGMEIIYVHFVHPRELVKAAMEENVDVIGITSSLGQHLLVTSLLLEELKNSQLSIPVIVGGIVPSVDVPKLLDMGVKQVFGPGSAPQEAVSFLSHIGQQK